MAVDFALIQVEKAKRAGDVSAFFRSQAKTSVAAATPS